MRKDTLLAFRLDAYEKKMFSEAAKAEEMPLSFWVRKTLKLYCRKRKNALDNKGLDAISVGLS